jgi:hypothetical protein
MCLPGQLLGIQLLLSDSPQAQAVQNLFDKLPREMVCG